jgi:hypothetical protein
MKHFSFDSDREVEISQKGIWSMMHHQEKAAEEYPLALLYQKYARVVLSYLDRRISVKEDAASHGLLMENGSFLRSLPNTSAGVVQVWNPQTGKLAFILATKPDYFMGTVSWSPDGQYIAVNLAKWNDSTR